MTTAIIDFSALAAPFEDTEIEWRAGATNEDKTKALALPYITAHAVIERLNEVALPGNWQNEYRPGPDGGLICGLALRVGDEWVTKWDGASNTDREPIKGGLSDALKRAARMWGIGLYLYSVDYYPKWVKCEPIGKKGVRLTETPTIHLKKPTNTLSKTDKPQALKVAQEATPDWVVNGKIDMSRLVEAASQENWYTEGHYGGEGVRFQIVNALKRHPEHNSNNVHEFPGGWKGVQTWLEMRPDKMFDLRTLAEQDIMIYLDAGHAPKGECEPETASLALIGGGLIQDKDQTDYQLTRLGRLVLDMHLQSENEDE